MSGKPRRILCFDNYPEAKMALGSVSYPVVIKPYGCENAQFFYEATDYGKASQVLYDAFEHTRNGWVVIESYYKDLL